MLPLSKLPVTRENVLRGYSIRNPSSNSIISSESTSKLSPSSSDNSNMINSGTHGAKQKLKTILENKSESSTTAKDREKTSSPIISVVQV